MCKHDCVKHKISLSNILYIRQHGRGMERRRRYAFTWLLQYSPVTSLLCGKVGWCLLMSTSLFMRVKTALRWSALSVSWDHRVILLEMGN